MRARIKQSNLKYFLRQEYGYNSLNQFFELTQNHGTLKQKVITHMVHEFTGYKIVKDKLVTHNPYTAKNESLKIKDFQHISTKEDLLKELSLLHKTRMHMLEQSRKRILELSKEKKPSRDTHLEANIQENAKRKKRQRLQELDKNNATTTQDLGR